MKGMDKMDREIIQQATQTYIKLPGPDGERLGEKMFMYQRIAGFLALDVTSVDGQRYYIYDTTGKITLAKYLDERRFGSEEAKKLLGQILRLPETLSRYLLDDGCVLIGPEDLYVDPRELVVEGIYLPGSPSSGIDGMGRVLEYMMDKMDPGDTKLTSMIYEMHRLTKEEGITLGRLSTYLDEDIGPLVEKRPTRTFNDYQEAPPTQVKRSHVPGNYLLPILFLLAGVIVTGVCWYTGLFIQPVSGAVDWAKGIGASVFFVAVAGYGAWKSWPEVSDGTTWEDEIRDDVVCLIPCQANHEVFMISHFPFVIGSEKGRVDGWLGMDDISPIHARILKEGSEVMIMDEDSKEGTYYNDSRLGPWQSKPLEDGDLLRFGKQEYVVEITV